MYLWFKCVEVSEEDIIGMNVTHYVCFTCLMQENFPSISLVHLDLVALSILKAAHYKIL